MFLQMSVCLMKTTFIASGTGSFENTEMLPLDYTMILTVGSHERAADTMGRGDHQDADHNGAERVDATPHLFLISNVIPVSSQLPVLHVVTVVYAKTEEDCDNRRVG